MAPRPRGSALPDPFGRAAFGSSKNASYLVYPTPVLSNVQILVDTTVEERRRPRQVLAGSVLPRSRTSAILGGTYAANIAAAIVATPSTAPLTIMIGVAAVLGTVSLMAADARSRWRRAESSDAHAAEPYRVSITEDGIRTWCEHVDIRYPWSDTLRITATAEFYVFLQGAAGGLALPRRALDVEAEAELRRALFEWAPAGAVQLPHEP